MVIHDEASFLDAQSLLDAHHELRYSDAYSYVVVTNQATLEKLSHEALRRGDIAVVVPVGQERSMEDHSVELKRVKLRRKVQEKKDFQSFMRSNPEFKKALDVAYKANPGLNVGKFVSHWKKEHGFESSETA